jgi:beta-phosphoglucomutase
VGRLRHSGWRQAIASSAPRANVTVMLEAVGIADLIDAVVSAEDVMRGKPEPDVFLAAAERLRVPPARCVVVEDAAAGIEAARRGGMASIGVSRHGQLSGDVNVRSLLELDPEAFDRLVTSGVGDQSSS